MERRHELVEIFCQALAQEMRVRESKMPGAYNNYESMLGLPNKINVKKEESCDSLYPESAFKPCYVVLLFRLLTSF